MKSVDKESGIAYGVDGCKAGWFCIALGPSETIEAFDVCKLGDLVAMSNDGDCIFIDIPIGLSDGPDERLCDREARRTLGFPRRSSVFRTPVRAALYAGNDGEAKRISLEATGKSISIQSLAIMPKIREVDTLLRTSEKARNLVREVHPEICFWALAGERPMLHNKKNPAGIEERIAVLERVWPSAGEEFTRICKDVPRRIAARDDILDAMAAAVTGCVSPVKLQALPELPPRDTQGLPMEMVYSPIAEFEK